MSHITSISLAGTAPFELGVTEVRPATREIIGESGREVLEPKVMQVLVLLARHPGEVVTRDDMIEACWDGRIVGNDALNRTIGAIRRVAETVGESSFQVETVVKVGYRLTELRSVDIPKIEDERFASPGEPVAAQRPARRTVLGLLAAGTAGGVGLVWWNAGRQDPVAALRAQGLEDARTGTAEVTARGLALVKEAAQRAPQDPESWGALALARLHANYFNSGAMARAQARAAHDDARRALELDSANISAQAALAMAMPPFGNWFASENAFRAVLVQDPDQHEMCIWLSRLLARVGRMREALAALDPVEEAIQHNPSALYWQSYLMWAVGRTKDGDRVIDRALRLWPRAYQVWFSRFWTYAYSGRTAASLRMVADTSRRPPGIPEWNFALIQLSAQALHSREAANIDAAQAAITAAAEKGAGFAEIGVELLSALGRVDGAFEIAQRYFFRREAVGAQVRYSHEQGVYSDRFRLNTRFLFTPPTAALRADRRFGPMATRLGLEEYWQQSATQPDYRIRRA